MITQFIIKKNFWNCVLVTMLPLLYTATTHAIVFDELTESQELTANGSGSPVVATINSPTVLGGSRQLFIQVLAAPNGFLESRIRAIGGEFIYTEEPGVNAVAVSTYNGSKSATTVLSAGAYLPDDPTGLGDDMGRGMDFTRTVILSGGAIKTAGDSIRMIVNHFDFPNNTPIRVIFRVFDMTGKYSEGTEFINQAVISGTPSSPLQVEIPYVNFVPGPSGAAAFNNVGAFQIILNGFPGSIDNQFRIGFLGTNGDCPTVPQIGIPIIDDCGDCNGINQRMDDCGICQAGVCQPNAVDPNCNQSCIDCLGVPTTLGGNALPGTPCDTGDVGQCKDGQWQGNPQQGACICEPNNEEEPEICFDNIDNNCDGVIDENNDDCLDCKGDVNGTATLDRCGVCEGDGQSCLECNSFDQSSVLRQLDGGAKRQERVIKAVSANILNLVPADSSTAVQVKKILETAHDFQVRNWILSWTLPRISTTCENTTFCVTTSNVSILTEYRERNDALFRMFKQVNKILRNLRGGRLQRRDKRYQRLAKFYRKDNLERSKTVPETQSACTS